VAAAAGVLYGLADLPKTRSGRLGFLVILSGCFVGAVVGGLFAVGIGVEARGRRSGER